MPLGFIPRPVQHSLSRGLRGGLYGPLKRQIAALVILKLFR
jgi:hypothetical protein